MGWIARLLARLGPSAALPLRNEESDAVLLGLHLVMRRGDADDAAAARTALAKFIAALPQPIDRYPDLTGVPDGPPKGDTDDIVARVRGALEAGCKLRLLYRDGERQWSRRVVRPIALRLDQHAAILAAWCETRSDVRHFRLDRIEHAEPVAEALPGEHRVLIAQYRAGEMVRGW
jgi:predicted DNA-binding transcriptional regulator YafY